MPKHGKGDVLNEEEEALGRILHACHLYHLDAEWEIARWERNYDKLNLKHKALVPSIDLKCRTARNCVQANQIFLSLLASAFQEPTLAEGAFTTYQKRLQDRICVAAGDADKVRYILKNAARDWSKEGSFERYQCYDKICVEVQKRLPLREDTDYKVLVPGCGLGRLPYELACLGYRTQGNEFSFYMLIASSFILNHSIQAEQWTIHPWMHSNCNQLSDLDQFRGVKIPDINFQEAIPKPGYLSMNAGDFVSVYSTDEHAASFDCLVTCFFLDCAHNVIEFIELIHKILKVGGIWVNFGPLLYHWADAHTYLPEEELSIELSLEDVENALQITGFEILQKCLVPAGFNTNLRSMMQNTYNCIFWTAKKELVQQNGNALKLSS